jgi:hypothetical protein
VRSSFEEFIETNLMVQSKFNLVFWFVSYNIFSSLNKWGPLLCQSSACSSPAPASAEALSPARGGWYRTDGITLRIADGVCSCKIAEVFTVAAAGVFYGIRSYRMV